MVGHHFGVVRHHPGVVADLLGVVRHHLGVVADHPGVVPDHPEVVPDHPEVVPDHLGVVADHPGAVRHHFGRAVGQGALFSSSGPYFAPQSTRPPMTADHEFEALLEADPTDGGVWLVAPAGVSAAYATRGPVPVQATLDGFPYRGTLAPLGAGRHGLLVARQLRRALGKTLGDTVRVALARAGADPPLPVPDDLGAALALAPAAAAYFAQLAPGPRQELLRWLHAAKKATSRAHRLAHALELLGKGRHR